MTWAKLDDRFPSHRKVVTLSDAAFRLHVTALCYCCEQLTDGFIDNRCAKELPRAPRGRALVRIAAELVAAGLWDAVAGGWQIHDFLDWNPTSQGILAKRAAAKDRMQRVRSRERNANDARTEREQIAKFARSSLNPVPVPVPVPNTDGGARAPVRVAPTVPPEASQGGQAPPAPPAPPSWESEDPGHPTNCPADLVRRAEAHGVLAELAASLSVPIASVRDCAEEFQTYWTIGGGTGRKQTAWVRRLRQRIVKAAREGHLRAPGAIEHAKTALRQDDGTPRRKTLDETIEEIRRGIS